MCCTIVHYYHIYIQKLQHDSLFVRHLVLEVHLSLGIVLGFRIYFFIFSADKTDRKSISCERTFSPTDNLQEMNDIIDKICESLAQDVARKNVKVLVLFYF